MYERAHSQKQDSSRPGWIRWRLALVALLLLIGYTLYLRLVVRAGWTQVLNTLLPTSLGALVLLVMAFAFLSQSQRRINEQEARLHRLQQAETEFNDASEPGKVAKRVLQNTVRLLPASIARLTLFHLGRQGADRWEWKTQSDGHITVETEISPGELAVYTADQAAPVTSAIDDSESPSLSPSSWPSEVQSVISVPLQGNRCVLGVLEAGFGRSRVDPDHTVHMLSLLASRATSALEIAYLHRKAAHKEQTTDALLDALAPQSGSQQLDQYLERVLDQLGRVLPHQTAVIAMVQGKQCWAIASRGEIPPSYHQFSIDDHLVVHQAINRKAPVVIADAQDLTDRSTTELVRSAHSWLVAPMVAKEHVIGLLIFSSDQPDAYTEESMRLASTCAHQVALKIENERLDEQLHARQREATLVRSVTAAISSTLDTEQVLSYMSRSLCEILNGTKTEIYTMDGERPAELSQPTAEYSASTTHRLDGGTDSASPSLRALPAVKEALDKKRPVQIQRAPSIDPSEKEVLDARMAQAVLILPMFVHDRAVGLATVWERQWPRKFTEGEISLGQSVVHQAAIAVENAHLFDEIRASAEKMEALYETNRALSSSLEEEPTIQTILKAVYRSMKCEHVLFSLVDEHNRTIGVKHGIWQGRFDVFPDWIEMSQYPLEQKDILTDIYHTGRTEIIGEWDERFNREIWDKFHHERFIRAFVPVKMRNRVLGVIEVAYDRDKKETISPDEVQTLTSFADQAAVAIQNARLFQQTQERLQELHILHDVALAAASGLRLEETLQAAADTLVSEMGDISVAFILSDPNTEGLDLKAYAGHSDRATQQDYVRLDEGITGWVARHGQPALVPDVKEDSRYLERVPETRSKLCVPIAVGPVVIGVLDVESPKPNAFSHEDQRLMSTLASNLAILIERVRLFEEVATARAELQARAEELEDANARLQELDKLKSRFLASMSHELRTPLNSIIGFSEILVEGLCGDLNNEQHDCVRSILISGEHLLSLINQVLDFSKIEAGRMELDVETFDVDGFLESVNTTIHPLVEKKDQSFRMEIEGDLPLLSADPFRLKQVLLNLLSNAQKFTPEEGHITLSCEMVSPSMMQFSVSDTGPGIKEKEQTVIFEEFRQADDTTHRQMTGTGLGLAISKRLVELHGGRIWVDSTYGEGSTFSFVLPIDGPEEAVAESDRSKT